MTLDQATIERAIEELKPIFGGRIQRVDLVDELELVLELRYPGRTLRLLVCARPGVGRIHLVPSRPPRVVSASDLQRILRNRLERRPLVSIAFVDGAIVLDALETVVRIRLGASKGGLSFDPPSGLAAPAFPEPGSIPERFPISESLADRYAARTAEDAAESLRSELDRSLLAQRRKLARLVENLDKDHDRLKALEAGRHDGELLKTVLGQIARGQTEVEVTDWETGEAKKLELDPALPPKKNLERLFSRAKKAERGLPIVAERRAKAEAELARIDHDREKIESAGFAVLIALRERSGKKRRGGAASDGLEGGAPRPRKEKKKPIDQWARRFEAADGTEIRVGKGAKENDRLTFSASRGDDVWLHASGTSGAHVLLRVVKGRSPSADAMLDAATLAAHYSGARAHAKVEVIYAEARHVRKLKGAPPGMVSVAKAKTILITIDPKRVDRLFGRDSGS